jgi:hypothetical protein
VRPIFTERGRDHSAGTLSSGKGWVKVSKHALPSPTARLVFLPEDVLERET